MGGNEGERETPAGKTQTKSGCESAGCESKSRIKFRMDSESRCIQMESIKSECAALLASWNRLEDEADEALGIGMRWKGAAGGHEGLDFALALIRASEAAMKYHRCRLKLERSKTPCDEEECQQIAWQAQCAESAAEACRRSISRERTSKENQGARTSKTRTSKATIGEVAWVGGSTTHHGLQFRDASLLVRIPRAIHSDCVQSNQGHSSAWRKLHPY